MDTTSLARFSPIVSAAAEADMRLDPTLGGHLTVVRSGTLTINWAPFDHINTDARIVLVGITPGRQQAVNALVEVRRQLRMGSDLATASRAAKKTASFSGAMRGNLVATLNHIGINRMLGIDGCATLFATDAGLVHYTSALRHPVFVDGLNYSGQPNMTAHATLRSYFVEHLGEEVHALPNAVWIPLGPVPTEALLFLAKQGILDRGHILDGLPHPSGANAERIAYFLGRKARAELSRKTDPVKLDAARDVLLQKVARLRR